MVFGAILGLNMVVEAYKFRFIDVMLGNTESSVKKSLLH